MNAPSFGHFPLDDRSLRIDMARIAALVEAAGFAAYVEQTGGGCATIYASRQWDEGTDLRIPASTGGRFDIAAGPGWFEPHWGAPEAKAVGHPSDFYVGPDDDGEAIATPCGGLDEEGIASLIIAKLKGEAC